MKRNVTCPETGHLERITVTEDPIDGHILGVEDCSRWSEEGMDCDHVCAHRLNQRLPNLMRAERMEVERRTGIEGRDAERPVVRETRTEAVSAVMSRDVVCVSASTSLDELAVLLDERRISGAPVVDERGCAIGMVSRTDLVTACRCRGASTPTTVREIMMQMTFSVPDDAPLATVVRLMAFEGVHRIPVIAADGTVAGIVSTLDVVRWLNAQL
jgi:CBS-domain-containing membrane protein